MKTILRDEIITIHRKQNMSTRPTDPNEDLSVDKSYTDINCDSVIQAVTQAVGAIKTRLEELMYFDQNEETKMTQLINKAKNPDLLCRMDPAYQPWL